MTCEIDRLTAHIDKFERALGERDDGFPRPVQVLDSVDQRRMESMLRRTLAMMKVRYQEIHRGQDST